jgi:predicted alpha/beta superfamily hydrolase
MLNRWLVCSVFSALVLTAFGPSARAQVDSEPRQNVLFSLVQNTSPGQSVYVLGDLPELGAWDMTRAVKLEPSAYPTWRATISLPAGRSYAYRYVLRSDAPTNQKLASNGSFITPANITASTPAQPRTVSTKTMMLTWGVENPVMQWRFTPYADQAPGAFAGVNMSLLMNPSPSRVNEKLWCAWGFGSAGRSIDFYFTDAQGGSRYPATGWYTTSLDGVYVQDGQQYTYLPAASPDAARRDYNPASPPTQWSPQLNENRVYRVFLPRGYSQHTSRRYPVLYMHDGQNVFEQGAFGTWNAGPQMSALQANGEMREIIVVALDNGPNRSADYGPPDDGGWWAYKYGDWIRDTLKPMIDAQYRTLTGPETTGAMGSSRGGNVSIYLGWDYPSVFRRVGAMSSALQLVPNFVNRVKSSAARNMTIYLDSSDAGYVDNDNYYRTYDLRDYFVRGTAPFYSIEGNLRHTVGFNANHDEASWAFRLPGALRFLYPARDGRNELLSDVFGAHWDRNADGRLDFEDLVIQGRSPIDIDLNGVIDAADTARLEALVRRNETTGMVGGQR